MESPDWLYWLNAPSLTLEDCVSISLNCQPTTQKKMRTDESGCSITWAITPHCLDDGVPNGRERLYRLRMYFDSRPDLLPPVLSHGENTKRIKLIDFVRFADALDWSMPPKLMEMLTDKDAQTPVKEQDQREDGESSESTPDRGRRVKRAALIADNVRRWPTIERDLKDASANGLSAAARDYAANGWWWEGSALEWARARAKVQDVSHGLAVLSSRVHRLRG